LTRLHFDRENIAKYVFVTLVGQIVSFITASVLQHRTTTQY